MSERALEAARESGLVRPGEPLLVMVSGGGDSVACSTSPCGSAPRCPRCT